MLYVNKIVLCIFLCVNLQMMYPEKSFDNKITHEKIKGIQHLCSSYTNISTLQNAISVKGDLALDIRVLLEYIIFIYCYKEV